MIPPDINFMAAGAGLLGGLLVADAVDDAFDGMYSNCLCHHS